MPIYPGRRAGTWRVVVWSKGRAHEQIVEGRKTDAKDAESRLRTEVRARSVAGSRGSLRFSELFRDRYAPFARTHLKASTWRIRRYQLAALSEHFGKIRTDELTIDHIEDFKSKNIHRPPSLNADLKVLKTILAFARQQRLKVVTDLTWKPLPTRSTGRVKTWTTDEVERLLSAAREFSPRLLRVLVFLVNTGCRKGEAMAAEWTWIDFANSMVRIPVNEFWQPKSGEPREIPMSDAVRAILSGTREHKQWVFPHSRSGPYVRFPDRDFGLIRGKAGVEGGPHTLRHTFASHFLKAIPDLFLLSKVLGHSQSRVTELYTHLLPDHLVRARNAVNISPPTMASTMASDRSRRSKRR